MTTDNNVQLLLAHLKQTVIKFEAGYAAMTEARAELHKVTANFKLETIPLPETYTPKQEDEATFDVAIWSNNTGTKLKASGTIDGTNYRVLLFPGTKEGVALQGSIVPSDAPDGADLSEISLGYASVKPNKAKDGYDLSLKFTQLDHWFSGPLEKVVSDNPKAPDFKAVMRKSNGSAKTSAANNPLLNVLQQLEVPTPVASEPATPQAPQAPDLFGSTFGLTAEPEPAPAQEAPKHDPVADLFAATAQVPSPQVPQWLLG